MAVDLKNHPGLNPDYFAGMDERRRAMAVNRARKRAAVVAGIPPHAVKLVPVPKQPNKYVPHIGAKQRGKFLNAEPRMAAE